ncbi:MAG: hypothetical protein ABSF71_21225, partial [Terriglobia bacterium]
ALRLPSLPASLSSLLKPTPRPSCGQKTAPPPPLPLLRADLGSGSPLANEAESIHTAIMSLKNAALLALIGTIVLTLLVLAHFISTVLGVMRDVIPAIALLTSLVHLFASLSVVVFFYVFYRKQS